MFLGFDSIKKQIPRPKAGLGMTNVLGPAAEYAGLKAAATNSWCDAVCSAGLQPGITLDSDAGAALKGSATFSAAYHPVSSRGRLLAEGSTFQTQG